jgi:hypothetical protein
VKSGVALPPDAAPPDAPLPDAPLGCPPGSGPTMHGFSVSADETLTAAKSPYVVPGDLSVYATLTLDPCVELRLPAKSSVLLSSTGRIVAQGNALQPIHITAAKAGQPFANIRASGGGALRLSYVNIDGGGDPLNTVPPVAGLINLQGTDNAAATQEILFVDHVHISGSASNGIVLHDGAGFAAGSTALTIDGSAEWPISVWARAAGTVPDGTYTGNTRDAIVIAQGSGHSAVQESMTLHERGVPYDVGDGLSAPEIRVDPPSSAAALVTLTIEPGVTLRFGKNGNLRVQTFTGTMPALAALVAVGTADKPIVFTSAAATPAAGDWYGVWYGMVPDPSNRIDHARFEYAGGHSSSGSAACPTTLGTISNDGAVRIFGPPASQFITNSAFVNSAGHGVDRGWRADNVTDFLPTNTFQNIAWCNQSYPSAATGACPPAAQVPCPR